MLAAKDTGEANSKGERLVRAACEPNVPQELPIALRQQQLVSFNPEQYDLRRAVADMLGKPELSEIGCFPDETCMLEVFRAPPAVFRSFPVRARLRDLVAMDTEFLGVYERLVEEVLCPRLKMQFQTHLPDSTPTRFSYQHPPTLRIQPGGSKEFKRPHRDKEYGHQIGEINFWMPLTAYSGKMGTGATLRVESEPHAGDFKSLDIEYGTIAMFHGTLCHHDVPANASDFTRISMDFRIGIGDFYDPQWTLEGVKAIHSRKELYL